MGFRDTLAAIVMALAFLAVIVGASFGLAWLANTVQDRYDREASEQCAAIASAADVKEYTVGTHYSCVLVKDGKIVTVKDW